MNCFDFERTLIFYNCNKNLKERGSEMLKFLRKIIYALGYEFSNKVG